MSNERINIRVCIDFPIRNEGETKARFFVYDQTGDTVSITGKQLRQLLLKHGSLVSVETSFGDGHETRDSVGLMDTLHSARSTLYARREPTTDPEGMSRNEVTPHRYMDIVLYRNQDATEPVARYPWHYSESRPKYGDSLVVHNCAAYYLIWLTDLVEEPAQTMSSEYRRLDDEMLTKLYRETGIALDRLPYSDEFERMLKKCPRGTMRRDLWLNLTRLRKNSKLPRLER